jgi:hypothetical protein
MQCLGFSMPTHTTAKIPQTRHLDRRAHQIIALSEGPADQLLDDQQLAAWFGVGPQWPAQSRMTGSGPPFIRTGLKRIRYRRDVVNAWLLSRQDTSTAATPAWNRGIPGSNRKLNGDARPSKAVAATGFKRGNAAPEHLLTSANAQQDPAPVIPKKFGSLQHEQPKPNRFKRGN